MSDADQKLGFSEALHKFLDEAPDPRDEWKNQVGFNVYAIGDWLELCQRAGVAHVPAEPVASVPIDALMTYDTNPDHPDLAAFFEEVEKAKKPNTILRWDAAAPAMVKHRLTLGSHEWDQSMLDWFTIDEERVFDILYSFPGEIATAWRRPWVTAALKDGYPVEYRAYVRNSELIGVGNYYVQRDLQWDRATRSDVRQVIKCTRKLLAAMEPPLRYGPAVLRFAPEERSFTVDFMRLESGDLVFLEGGPPYGAGAHPTCFPADESKWEEYAVHSIDGVRVNLTPDESVFPESDRELLAEVMADKETALPAA